MRKARFRYQLAHGQPLNSVAEFPDDLTFYQAIDYFVQHVDQKGWTTNPDAGFKLPMEQLTTLHNDTGLSTLKTVQEMTEKLSRQIPIVNLATGLPNVHILAVWPGKYVIVNGHHTILAYQQMAQADWSKIPYVIVEDKEQTYFNPQELMCAFNQLASQIKPEDWQQYSINWRVGQGILEPRRQKNMAELFTAVGPQLTTT